jgi:hypothetical protein
MTRQHRSKHPICDCGSRNVVKFIGTIPSCQPCLDKDSVWFAMNNDACHQDEIDTLERMKQQARSNRTLSLQ